MNLRLPVKFRRRGKVVRNDARTIVIAVKLRTPLNRLPE